MNKDKKTGLILGITAGVLLVAVSAFILFKLGKTVKVSNTEPGPEQQQTDKSREVGENAYAPEEFKPVWIFPTDGNFPAWTHPMPFINPMGGEKNYSHIETETRSYYSFDYADMQSPPLARYVYGDKWVLHIPFDPKLTTEENHQFIIDIELFIKNINGTIMGYNKDSIVFIVKDENDIHWWAEAAIEHDRIILSIVKQDELKTGETFVIKTTDHEDRNIKFASYNPGNEFQSIFLEYDQGEIFLDITTDNCFGEYRRSYRTNYVVYDDQCTSAYYDSIMYDPGFSNWDVSWLDSGVTGEIRITLLKTGEIPPVRYGEPLGAIKVSSEHVSGIEAVPTGGNNLYISHPEFSNDDFYLDRTPDGDCIVFVPAGLWDVKIRPESDPLVSYYETLMVPVNSGEVTTIDVPYSISKAMNAKTGGFDERGLRIGSIEEDVSNSRTAFSFILLDKSTKDILPDTGNTSVMESGAPVKLISVSRLETPPDVVLLLDSSGSMIKQMQTALNAAAEFVKGLPENASIRIVDFDDKIRELKGTTKEEALKNLKAIKADGDTALYNSIELGLEMLSASDRPTLVVFTDGENDLKEGTTLTLEETMDLVRKAEVPLFTIGFGKGHDSRTLEGLAKVSDGLYFNAEDGEALKKVFAAINENLGSTFEAVYERPKEASPGDVPVVSFVVDVSGSMGEELSKKYGSRIHNVRNLLRQFAMELPDETQMQLTEFDDDVRIVQALTTDKMKIVRGIGRLEPLGGTDIEGSVHAGYETLKAIPSTKKVLVYITDAALGTTGDDKEGFRELLALIKKDEINVIWVGLGIEDEYEIEQFSLAAEITGGRYVTSEDVEVLKENFNAVLREVRDRPESELSNLFISIEKTTATGARESYSTSKLVNLTPVKKNDQVIVAETMKYITGGILKQYDSYTAGYLSGCGIPGQDTIITKKMPVDNKSGANQAARIRAENLVFLEKFAGVEAPNNYRFMALIIDMKNILEAQEVTIYPDGSSHPSSWVAGGAKGKTEFIKIPYIIPDITSHFSLSYNNEGAYQASLATWLAEKPLAAPGDTAVTIKPDESASGALVFLVPDTPMEQAALHFYDINYGHIDLPLVGEMKRIDRDINSLPVEASGKLLDTFSLDITGYGGIPKIPGTGKDTPGQGADGRGSGTVGGGDGKGSGTVGGGDGRGSGTVGGEDSGGNSGEYTDGPEVRGIIPGAGSVFKVVEGNFTSRMQALLDVDPLERFSLRLNTVVGDFYIPLNPATNLLPAGFANARMISPGSFNRFRWLFEVPEGLKNSSCEIYTDLKGSSGAVTVKKGDLLPAGLNKKYESEFVDLTVNNFAWYKEGIHGNNWEYAIADITIHDKKDGLGSSGISELFSVVTDEFLEKAGLAAGDGSGDSGAQPYADPGSGGLGSFGQQFPGESSTENRLLPDELTEKLILGFADSIPVYDGTDRRGLILFQMPYREDEEKDWYLYSESFKGLKLKLGNEIFDKGLLGLKAVYESDSSFVGSLSTAIALAVEKYRLSNPDKTDSLTYGTVSLEEPGSGKREIPVPSISYHGSELIDSIKTVDDMISAMKKLRYIPGSSSYYPFNHSFSKEALMTQGFGTEQDYANMAAELLSKLGYRPKLKTVKLTDRGRAALAKMSGIKNIDKELLPAVAYTDGSGGYHVLVMPFLEDLELLRGLVHLEYAGYIEKKPNTVRLEINALGYLTEKGAREQMGDIADALGGGSGEPVLVSQQLYNDYINLDTLSLDSIDIGLVKEGDRARVYLMKADGNVAGDQFVELDKLDVKQIQLMFDLPNKANVTHTARLDEGMSIDDVFMTVSINAPDLSEKASAALQEKASQVYDMAKDPNELSSLRWYGRSIIAKFISMQTVHDNTIIDKMGLVAGRTARPRVIVITNKMKDRLKTSISLLQTGNEIHEGGEEAIRSLNIISGLYASSLEAQVLPGQAGGVEYIWSKAPEGTKLVFIGYFANEDAEYLRKAGMPEDILKHFEYSQNMVLITDKPSIIDGEKRWAWFEIHPETYETISVIDTLEKGAFVESTLTDMSKGAGQFILGAFLGVDTSIWSVAAFSLELDDYREILEASMAFALGLAENFGVKAGPVGASMGGKPSVSQGFGPVKFSFDGNAKASQNVLNFTEGYMAGVEYYFSAAQ